MVKHILFFRLLCFLEAYLILPRRISARKWFPVGRRTHPPPGHRISFRSAWRVRRRPARWCRARCWSLTSAWGDGDDSRRSRDCWIARSREGLGKRRGFKFVFHFKGFFFSKFEVDEILSLILYQDNPLFFLSLPGAQSCIFHLYSNTYLQSLQSYN